MNWLFDFIVISEVINKAIRIEYEKHLHSNHLDKKELSYKRYRDGEEGIEALTDIYLIVKENILQTFTIQGKAFSKTEIETFLRVEPLDFMDKALIPICTENNCILLTNDKDFSSFDIDILSANPAIPAELMHTITENNSEQIALSYLKNLGYDHI